MILPRFYPIFDSADWIERMVPLGVKLVQLRIKDKPDSHIRQEVRRAKRVCDAHDTILIINDYWEIAAEEGCGFIHLGQEDMDAADWDAIRAAGLKFGLSTHDGKELERALAMKPEYVALGPVFPTILKKMKWNPQGLERVTEWKKRVGPTPLVGIGGLTVERGLDVLRAGADSVAAVTDITLNDDPEARVREWIEAVQ
ncbi:thiamine phosphate synthase [Falsihalocynthiibacter sp. SS001]|uniref:thiamine phosphate synthase n=1 Tax=Falsihalocynthiibacter sp. SS001 TaxID=3349698 RepID=UPI0036D2B72D